MKGIIASRQNSSKLLGLAILGMLAFNLLLAPLLVGLASASGESWLHAFRYRKHLVISGSTGAGVNYAVKIEVYYTSTPSQLGCEEHCRTDFGDVRFTDGSGANELDYWLQEKADGDHAVFWVEVSDDLSSSDAAIYMYYGKSTEATTSNGDSTFLFFDDFSGTALNTSKWDPSGSVSVSDGVCTIIGDFPGVEDAICGKTLVGVNHAYEARSRSTAEAQTSLLCASSSVNFETYNHFRTYSTVTRNATGMHFEYGISGISIISMHRYKIERISSAETRFYYEDELKSTHTEHIDSGNEGAAFLSWGGTVYVDWVFIRKFVSPELSMESWGSEETRTIESCDSNGVEKDTFSPGESVYVNGSGYNASTTYPLRIVSDITWSDNIVIPAAVVSTTVTSNSTGHIEPVMVWGSALPGGYDIVVDVNDNGIYDEDIDALDDLDVSDAGFFVIPEYEAGTILALAVCFAGYGFYRSKRKL